MQGNSKPGVESVTSEEALCPLMAPIKDSRTDWVLCSCQLSPMSVYDFLRQSNITSLAKQNPEHEWTEERLVNIPAFLLLLPSIREQQQSSNKVSEELY